MANILTNRWQLSRRKMLRGIGATMALPFLEAMRPLCAASATAIDPVRMAVLFFPNGVREDVWTPDGKGSAFKLSPILSPLEQLKEDLLVISGLTNPPAHQGDGHYFKDASFLTCSTIEQTDGANINAHGVSMDQIAANAIGQNTKLPSLELGIEPLKQGVDQNARLTNLYGSHIAWKKPDLPLPCEINPQIAFDNLYKDRRKNVTNAPTIDPEKSVLDIVMEDAKRLQKSLGTEDNHKLEQYLDSVREVERRIGNSSGKADGAQKITPQVLEELNKLKSRISKNVKGNSKESDLRTRMDIPHEEHVQMMLDLMVLAFWSDTTRISTFMFGSSVSQTNFSFIDGVDGAHHSISHHKNDKSQLEMYQKINTWHVAQYAYMLGKMKAIKEGDGTLLDKSMVLFGSGIRDGNKHDPKDLPIVVAGGANGQLKTGRHLAAEGESLDGLYRGMLKRLGIDKAKFGEGNAELRGL